MINRNDTLIIEVYKDIRCDCVMFERKGRDGILYVNHMNSIPGHAGENRHPLLVLL